MTTSNGRKISSLQLSALERCRRLVSMVGSVSFPPFLAERSSRRTKSCRPPPQFGLGFKLQQEIPVVISQHPKRTTATWHGQLYECKERLFWNVSGHAKRTSIQLWHYSRLLPCIYKSHRAFIRSLSCVLVLTSVSSFTGM